MILASSPSGGVEGDLLDAMSRNGIILHGFACAYATLLINLPPEGGTIGSAAYAVALDGGGDGFARELGAQPSHEVTAPRLRLLAGAVHLLVMYLLFSLIVLSLTDFFFFSLTDLTNLTERQVASPLLSATPSVYAGW
jgi:hypothetical protein